MCHEIHSLSSDTDCILLVRCRRVYRECAHRNLERFLIVRQQYVQSDVSLLRADKRVLYMGQARRWPPALLDLWKPYRHSTCKHEDSSSITASASTRCHIHGWICSCPAQCTSSLHRKIESMASVLCDPVHPISSNSNRDTFGTRSRNYVVSTEEQSGSRKTQTFSGMVRTWMVVFLWRNISPHSIYY